MSIDTNGTSSARAAQPLSYEIFSASTNKTHYNLVAALRIGKIIMEAARYDQASGTRTAFQQFYFNIGDAKLLCYYILSPHFLRSGWKFERFAGSVRDEMVISRSFNLQFDEGDNKKFGNYPFRIILKEGPGEQTATGAIKPLGQATSSVDIRVPIDTFYTSMLELQDWLRARQGEIERQRWEAQVQKFQRKQAERVG
jgi:hypothetical protein